MKVLIVPEDPTLDQHVLRPIVEHIFREGEHPGKLIACLAVEEVETWLLALLREELAVPWTEVRAECHPKERFWAPLVERRRWHQERDGGRVRVIRERLGKKWSGLLTLCPELQELREKIAAWWAARAAT